MTTSGTMEQQMEAARQEREALAKLISTIGHGHKEHTQSIADLQEEVRTISTLVKTNGNNILKLMTSATGGGRYKKKRRTKKRKPKKRKSEKRTYRRRR